MRLGFSTVACPDWDLERVVDQATSACCDVVELAVPPDGQRSPVIAELSDNPESIRRRLADAGLGMECLATPVALHHRDQAALAAAVEEVRRYIDLASRSGCPLVRVWGKTIHRWPVIGPERRAGVIERIARALTVLATSARDAGVSLVVENGGDFASARDLWNITNRVDRPAVAACWNTVTSTVINELAVAALPSLSPILRLVHLGDAKANSDGVFESCNVGEGQVGIAECIDMLKSINYDGAIVYVWPRAANSKLAPPEDVLPVALKYIGGLMRAEPVVLTAYRTDKYAPKFATKAAGA
jgi:sugar phosphate isomerase/epimerase